jgi:hypothetical protein
MNRRTILQAGLAAPFLLPNLLEAATGGQRCLNNICFDRLVRVGETEISLRGMARLTWWGFNVYTSSFHAPDSVVDTNTALADVPRLLTIHYHRAINASDIAKASRVWVERCPRNDLSVVGEPLERLYALYKSVSKDDRYRIRYVPGQGLSISLNDDPWSDPIPGAPVASAFYGIWLSEVCINATFRDRLLGRR